MNFHKDMLTDKRLDDIENIKAMLTEHTAVFGVYLICVCRNQTVIVSSAEALKLKGEWTVIGMAESKKRCFEFIRDIVERLYKQGNEIDIPKAYVNSSLPSGELVRAAGRFTDTFLSAALQSAGGLSQLEIGLPLR